MFNYFFSNKFFVSSQSGFLPGDSSIVQLLSVIHEIQTALDNKPTCDVRGVFFIYFQSISKSLAWSYFEVKIIRCWGWITFATQNYLQNRKQVVVLNGKKSRWRKINSGVPQGSLLGPLLFLIYINDLHDEIIPICNIFADDKSLFSNALDINKSATELNSDLKKISQWVYQWKIKFNPDPNKQANEIFFSRKLISNNLSQFPC